MQLTHDKGLYFMQYNYQGQSQSVTFRNRCMYVYLEGVCHEKGLRHLASLFDRKEHLPYVYLQKRPVEGEELYVAYYQEKPSLLNVNYVPIGYLPDRLTNVLDMSLNGQGYANIVNAFFVEDKFCMIELAILARFCYPHQEPEGGFEYSRVPGREMESKEYYVEIETISQEEFEEGVFDQEMKKGTEQFLDGYWGYKDPLWSLPSRINFERTYKPEKKKYSYEECLLHIHLDDIALNVSAEDVLTNKMMGCVFGCVSAEPDKESGKYHVSIEKNYDMLRKGEKLRDPANFIHLATVPVEYNDEIKRFTESSRMPLYAHVTVDIVDGKPKLKGDAFLLKCYEGYERRLNTYARKKLFHLMQHKNDYAKLRYRRWAVNNK